LLVVAAAAIASVEEAIEYIDNAYEPLRKIGMGKLREAGSEAFDELVEAFDGLSLEGRRCAAILLREFSGEMASIEPHGRRVVSLLLETTDDQVEKDLSATLAKCGPRSLGRILMLAVRGGSVSRGAARDAMARIGEPAWPRVQRLLDSPSSDSRIVGLDIVARAGEKGAVFEKRVLELCDDRSDLVRGMVLDAFAAIATDRDRALRLLLDALEPDARVLWIPVSRGLARCGAPAAEALVTRVEKRNGEGVEAELYALQKLGPSLAPVIEKGFASDSPRVHVALLRALRPISDAGFSDTAWRALSGLCARPEEEFRGIGYEMLLGAPEANEARPLLVEMASDDSAGIRARVVEHFARADAPGEFLDLFRGARDDSSPDVRAAAWLGLHRSLAVDRPGVDALGRLVTEHGSAAAARAIGEIGFLAQPLLDDMLAATRSDSREVAVAAVLSIGEILDAHVPGSPQGRRKRFFGRRRDVRKACERALAWLAKNQAGLPDSKGRGWDCDAHGGHSAGDVGVTSLALLAFAATGCNADSETHGKAVTDALLYLRSRQHESGLVGTPGTAQFMVQHAMATNALCDAYCLTAPDAAERIAARRAIEYAVRARNPKLAWRYDPRGGENDMFVTAWMVSALYAGQLLGVRVDPDAHEGARMWVGKMTDPEFGQVGYNVPGGSPARPIANGSLQTRYRFTEHTQSTTAMGLWLRILLERADAPGSDTFKLGEKLVTDLPPAWEPGRVDLIYWMFGSRAVVKGRGAWFDALDRALLRNQDDDGSWPPVGVWGIQGGRVYSTATAVLALIGADVYGPGLVSAEKPKWWTRARDRVLALTTSDDERIAEAARAALR